MNPVSRTLVIGATGYVGKHLLAHYRKTYPDALGTSRRAAAIGDGYAYLDLQCTDLEHLDLAGYRHAIIAGAAARVEACEREPHRTAEINVNGTIAVIRQLWEREILPIFLSTDYVFDGARLDGYDDLAHPNPCTEYGRQKAAVEAFLAESGRPFLVLRLGKVFGVVKGDGTLVDEMAGLLTTVRTVAAAGDQVFCPVWVEDMVRVVEEIQRRDLRGIVNLCSPWPWRRFDLARAVARAVKAPLELVREISLDDLPGLARRPKCTRHAAAPAGEGSGFSFHACGDLPGTVG